MVKIVKVLLCPQPEAKPEFLDDFKLKEANKPESASLWNEMLPKQIVLEGYTRDGWAWKPNPQFVSIQLETVTGRPHKLENFVKYLKERKKSCYGRFAPNGVVVFSFVQPGMRVAVDVSQIGGYNLKPLKVSLPSNATVNTTTNKPAPERKRKGPGLLGSLVGAQQRTNHHVAVATKPKRTETTVDAVGKVVGTKSAQEVLAAFRNKMEEKMMAFDENEHETVVKVQLVASKEQAGLSEEDKARVSMETLKFMVYEAAEEVNEEWVAYKEPSEFMDEVTIAVYKEGVAPPEVLEEMNKAELPDEVRGQQRAIQEERQRQAVLQHTKFKGAVEREVHRMEANDSDEDFAVLNQKKRDRRTIEDYEREKRAKTRQS